jgi:hypothetical protein
VGKAMNKEYTMTRLSLLLILGLASACDAWADQPVVQGCAPTADSSVIGSGVETVGVDSGQCAGRDPGGTGGTGNTGGGAAGAGGMGTGGVGGSAPEGACSNEMDEEAICSPTFTDDFTECGLGNIGNPEGAQMCIEGIGISSECATCWSENVSCLVTNCLGQCAGGGTPECLECQAEFCTPALVECAGFTTSNCP